MGYSLVTEYELSQGALMAWQGLLKRLGTLTEYRISNNELKLLSQGTNLTAMDLSDSVLVATTKDYVTDYVLKP